MLTTLVREEKEAPQRLHYSLGPVGAPAKMLLLPREK